MRERTVWHIIDDLLQTIAAVQGAMEGKSVSDFSEDQQLRWAVERGIEIISEASRRLPDDLRELRPEIHWPRISGIGNVLRHEYYRISNSIIYTVATSELEPLRVAIAAIAETLGDDD